MTNISYSPIAQRNRQRLDTLIKVSNARTRLRLEAHDQTVTLWDIAQIAAATMVFTLILF